MALFSEIFSAGSKTRFRLRPNLITQLELSLSTRFCVSSILLTSLGRLSLCWVTNFADKKPPLIGRLFVLVFDRGILSVREDEGLHQKDRHLCASNSRIGAIVSTTTSSGDVFSCQLLDEIGCKRSNRDIPKDSACCSWRHERTSMFAT